MHGRFERWSNTGAGLCALGLAASAVLGCAATGRVDSAREPSEGAGFRVVVAPVNLAFPVPMELDDEPDHVFAELLRYYLEQDAHVAIIAEPDATRLWREVAAATPGDGDRSRLEAVARSFTRALGEHAQFDLVVLPALVSREVRLRRGLARWDGVERRLAVRDRRTPGSRTTLPWGESAGSSASSAPIWNEDVSALSLYVLFVTREGGKVSEGWGGISLLQEAVVRAEGGEHATLLPSREVVSSPSQLREAVSLALAASPLP